MIDTWFNLLLFNIAIMVINYSVKCKWVGTTSVKMNCIAGRLLSDLVSCLDHV